MHMKCILVLAQLVGIVTLVKVQTGGYHTSIGIPLAEELRQIGELEALESDGLSKTVGGRLSDIKNYPYFAGLLIKLLEVRGASVCGATLISSNRLVSAAHCWYDGHHHAYQYVVVMDTASLFSDGVRIKTNKVVTHPNWNPTHLAHDISIVYLPYSVPISDTLRPVTLPSGEDLKDSHVGQWATAVGYGKISDEDATVFGYANEVTLQIVPLENCVNAFGDLFVTPNIICASHNHDGPCKGDSGGPLLKITNGIHILIGLSSFSAEEGCALGFPSGFTRIASYMDFIRQNMV